ncbi:hypothetical protein BGZ97_010517, partial [Linnemannia gamsii]
LDPPRIAAIPDTVLDVVVERTLNEKEDDIDVEEDMALLELQVASAPLRTGNPEYGLPEEAMALYAQFPVSDTPVRAPQLLPNVDDGDSNTVKGSIADPIDRQSSHNDDNDLLDNPPFRFDFEELNQLFTDPVPDRSFTVRMLIIPPSVVQEYIRETKKRHLGLTEQGDSEAQSKIRVMYDEILGTRGDYRHALEWYLELGDSDAQFNVGVMYDEGLSVMQDYRQAMEWYLKAAEQGHSKAQFNIGVLYDEGQGVDQDYRQAMT